jgi:hypothetical protein
MERNVAYAAEDGVLTIRVTDPAHLPFSSRPEQAGVKWYVAPSIGTYLSDVQGVGVNASGNASLSFNYSEQSWRVQQSIGTGYSQLSQPVPGTNETASVHFVGARATNVLAWSLTPEGPWSAGLLLSDEKNPQGNYALRWNASLGFEFDLVPRVTVNQKNFGFRCAPGPEFQRYDTTNVQGRQHQLIGRQFCDLVVTWHFTPIDVSAWPGQTLVLEDVNFRSFNAGFSSTWRVTEDFTISPWLALQQVHQAINEAQSTNVVYSDPRQEIEASMLAAVNRGYTAPFSVQSDLSIRYLFGNGSLATEDQRWKNTTNLR